MIFIISLVCIPTPGILFFTYTSIGPFKWLWHMMIFNRLSFLKVESNVWCTKHYLPFRISKFLDFIHHPIFHKKLKHKASGTGSVHSWEKNIKANTYWSGPLFSTPMLQTALLVCTSRIGIPLLICHSLGKDHVPTTFCFIFIL